jgi:hypothetical protein
MSKVSSFLLKHHPYRDLLVGQQNALGLDQAFYGMQLKGKIRFAGGHWNTGRASGGAGCSSISGNGVAPGKESK